MISPGTSELPKVAGQSCCTAVLRVVKENEVIRAMELPPIALMMQVTYSISTTDVPSEVHSAGASLLPYGKMSQNALFAIALAFLLSAEVPGVKVLLSPAVLKDAACCKAVLMAFVFVPQYADSH